MQRHDPSPFLDAKAVETWDTWFRWREGGRLRDLSIEATWQRIAHALSDVESVPDALLAARIVEAQSRWQLVFDERLLASAGTNHPHWPADPVAVLNAAAFVIAPFTPNAAFDAVAFRDTAALAVRCLDNAALHFAAAGNLPLGLRIGLIGLADALVLLGKRYDSPAGRVTAGAIARALAEGALAGSIRLARERGPAPASAAALAEPWQVRGVAAELMDDLARHGVRHTRLTEVSSQARLATFANCVADALDPVDPRACAAALVSGKKPVTVPAFAVSLARATLGADACTLLEPLLAPASLSAQIEMRGTVQPWIDAKIDYPFHGVAPCEQRASDFLQRLATAHRLGPLVIAH